MPEVLLQTKLYIPARRPNLVPRPSLVGRLNQALQPGCRLGLISAPAGFGKTTLLSEWVAVCGCPAAWLSLDDGDSDVTRFLTYFVAALQTLALGGGEGNAANVGEGALAALQSSQPAPLEPILTALLNEIAVLGQTFALVLDDYHVIDTKAAASTFAGATTSVDGLLTFLLEHLPPQMHLVIATREDPALPLARLRGRGQLIELRAADLRFTGSEAAGFLNQAMGLNLSAEEVAALETRTEGWIAGLQLAALALQGTPSAPGRDDTAAFIQAFSGGHHFILDYLAGEVLQRQPEDVRSFLLQTSILDRLSGPLADAVCSLGSAVRSGTAGTPGGQGDGKEMLEKLERGNLFVVPLDDERHWYRYHHLFADVLQARLMEEQPDQVPVLHRRASEWYEHNGSPADAIHHALAAEDFERATGLVELAWPEMDWSFQSTAWLGWAKALPDELVRERPVLSAGYAWALINDGELEAGETRLRDAEHWLDAAAAEGVGSEGRPAGMVVVDEEQFRSLPATIASARVYHAQALGDVSGSVKYARLAHDLLPEEDHLGRGRIAVLLGLAYWTSGELEAARRTLSDAMITFQAAGNILYAISFTFILADIRVTQGRLHDAVSTYERSLRLAREQGEPVLQETAMLYLGLSELYREWGDPESARRHLRKSEELGDQSEVYHYRRCRAQARIKEALGDLNGALDLLDEAERWLFYRNPIPDVRPIAALKARVWVRQGSLAEALGWVREQDLSPDDALSYLHEFEHITLARVLIAQYERGRVESSIHEALRLLERLLEAAQEGGRKGSVIEILLLQSLAQRSQGDLSRALNPLERALALAEPQGYVRIFVDEGPPMAALLQEAAKSNVVPNYVSQLLLAFGRAAGTEPSTQPLIEPLSEREREVLRLLASDLNGPEIARQLTVSLNTMRTHTKNIYTKLGVNNRRAAVRRAGELDLL